MHIPGVLEMEANSSLYVNKARLAALPPSYQAVRARGVFLRVDGNARQI